MDAPEQPTRRSFLNYMVYAMGSIAVGAAGLVMIDSMNPAADARERGIINIDLKNIQAGARISFVWMAGVTLIYRRTPEDILQVRAEDWRALRDPQSDESRVQKGYDEWLVVNGMCTLNDCPLMWEHATFPRGKWGGWQCPRCGSSYDKSGRVRNGPAPKNLYLPVYRIEPGDRLTLDTRSPPTESQR